MTNLYDTFYKKSSCISVFRIIFFLLNIITKDKQLKLISYFVSFYRFNILCDRSFIRVF